jgi:hypothetical protein
MVDEQFVNKVKELAKIHKLAAVNFLDADGKATDDRRAWKIVRLTFSNHEVAEGPIEDFDGELKNLKFNLMPVEEHEAWQAQEDAGKAGGRLQ